MLGTLGLELLLQSINFSARCFELGQKAVSRSPDILFLSIQTLSHENSAFEAIGDLLQSFTYTINLRYTYASTSCRPTSAVRDD